MYRSAKQLIARQLSLIIVLTVAAPVWFWLLSHQPVSQSSGAVLVWWTALFAISALNVWLWRQSAEILETRRANTDPALFTLQRWQLVLSAVYVLGCAFRSILPRADVQRIGLIDSWISSVLVGRSVATVAELCFAAQWALLLNWMAKDANSRIGVRISWLIVPLIAVAEVCSWYGVLTTAYIGNAIEESIWALSGGLLVLGFAILFTRSKTAVRPLLGACMVLGVMYVTYMCTVDVPMYVTRFLEDEARGRQYLSLSQGLWDVGSRWVVTHAWDEWHAEVPWMSLYFSVGVWCSLALVHFPRTDPSESQAISLDRVAPVT